MGWEKSLITVNIHSATFHQKSVTEAEKHLKMRKILIIGGHGVVGSEIIRNLRNHCNKYNIDIQIIIGARNVQCDDDIYVDLDKSSTIKLLFKNEKFRDITDIVCCAGKSLCKDILISNRNDIKAAFNAKVFGQMELVIEANKHFNNVNNHSGSNTVTLTSGHTAILNIKDWWCAAVQNSALNRFVQTTVMETPNICVNIVCPGLLTGKTAQKIGHKLPGFNTVSGDDVAMAYLRCIFGQIRGKVLHIDAPNQWIQSNL
eukprot:533567_1